MPTSSGYAFCAAITHSVRLLVTLKSQAQHAICPGPATWVALRQTAKMRAIAPVTSFASFPSATSSLALCLDETVEEALAEVAKEVPAVGVRSWPALMSSMSGLPVAALAAAACFALWSTMRAMVGASWRWRRRCAWRRRGRASWCLWRREGRCGVAGHAAPSHRFFCTAKGK